MISTYKVTLAIVHFVRLETGAWMRDLRPIAGYRVNAVSETWARIASLHAADLDGLEGVKIYSIEW